MPTYPIRHALLLRRTPFGESSLVVQVLTPDLGRVDLVAKGAYRANSRFYAVLDWFHTLELSFPEKTQGLAPLSGADWGVRRKRISGDPTRFRSALTVLELASAAARQGSPEPTLFAATEATLQHLESGDLPPSLEQLLFELEFLQILGVAPALIDCAACGGSAPPIGPIPAPANRTGAAQSLRVRVPFSAGSGGRLCRACAESARRAGMRVGTMPADVLEAAHKLPDCSRDLLAYETPDPGLVQRILDFTGRYLDFHLESHLRCQSGFLSQPNRNAPDPKHA